MKKVIFVSFSLLLILTSWGANAQTIIKVQMVMGKDSPEYVMATKFSEDVAALTSGEVIFKILPKLKNTQTKGLVERINKGEIGGGIAWTHYWSSYHLSLIHI